MNTSVALGLLLVVWCGIQLVVGLRGGRVFAHGMRRVGREDSEFSFYMVLYALCTLAGLVIALRG